VFCFIAVLSALIFSLLAPKKFESTVTLLPPPEPASGSGLAGAGLRGQLQEFGLGNPSSSSRQEVIVSVLESRTLAERLVEKYDLVKYYQVAGPRVAPGPLINARRVSVSKAGMISVTVSDGDPRMAAELANAHPVELNKLLRQMDVRESTQKRRFILDRLGATETRLKVAEEALMSFQQQNRAVSLRAQAEGVMNVAGQLKGQIMSSEIELQVARTFSTESNPKVVELRQRIDEIKKQLAQLQYGTGLDLPHVEGSTSAVGSRNKEIHLAAADVPKLGLQFARLSRDLKVQETVYTMLTQQLEEAQIAEARNVLAVQVLDPAIPALRKSSPRTTLNMALAGTVSFVLGICLVFVREYLDVSRSEAGQPHNLLSA